MSATPRLVRDHLLGAQRDPHRVLGRQRERLVERVRVQRLRPAEHRRERLDRGAHDVHLRLLRRQRDAGGLRVEAHQPATAGRCAPNRSRSSRAQIRRAARNFAISSKKSLCALKKNDSRGANVVDGEAARDRRLDVGEAVRERERELLHRRRAGLADVVAGDRDRVP